MCLFFISICSHILGGGMFDLLRILVGWEELRCFHRCASGTRPVNHALQYTDLLLAFTRIHRFMFTARGSLQECVEGVNHKGDDPQVSLALRTWKGSEMWSMKTENKGRVWYAALQRDMFISIYINRCVLGAFCQCIKFNASSQGKYICCAFGYSEMRIFARSAKHTWEKYIHCSAGRSKVELEVQASILFYFLNSGPITSFNSWLLHTLCFHCHE